MSVLLKCTEKLQRYALYLSDLRKRLAFESRPLLDECALDYLRRKRLHEEALAYLEVVLVDCPSIDHLFAYCKWNPPVPLVKCAVRLLAETFVEDIRSTERRDRHTQIESTPTRATVIIEWGAEEPDLTLARELEAEVKAHYCKFFDEEEMSEKELVQRMIAYVEDFLVVTYAWSLYR